MRSPITALAWEIWRRNRGAIWLVIGITSFGWFFNQVLPESFRAAESGRNLTGTVNGLLMVFSLLLVFGIFNFTESSQGKEWTGFPYRLFALPVPTWLLVTLPVALGAIGVGLVYATWANLILTRGEIAEPWWFAVLLGAYMVFYQAVLWCFAGFRISRMIVLGFSGPLFVFIGCLPFTKEIAPAWLPAESLSWLLAGVAFLAYGNAWFFVARQRCGGGRRRNGFKALVERMGDRLPRRNKGFSSPAAAQFWFEWRRSGLLLPLCIGVILILVIGPLSWHLSNDAAGTLWVLAWTLAMPLILAAPLGKGFSKPDFWSKDLSLPAFVAVRPLSTGEFVVTKMKVAALSAAISWFLILAFLSTWFPLWAELSLLSMPRIGFWMVHGHSVYPQYAIAALFIIGLMFLTWKFLVGGLWIGLSANRKLFIGSPSAYGLLLLAGMIGLTMLARDDAAVRGWIRDDPNRLLSYFQWMAAFAVIGKFWAAAVSWRQVTPRRVRQYLLLWSSASLALIALAMLLWADGTLSLLLTASMGFPPLDVERLRIVLILMALLVVPFARLGLAPSSLAKNRHA